MTMFVQIFGAAFAAVWAVCSIFLIAAQLTIIIKETSATRKALFGTPAKFFVSAMGFIAVTLLGPVFIGYLFADASFEAER